MNPTLRNVLAVVAGLIIGSIVNMSLVNLSGTLIPPPPGTDVTTPEGLKASMHLFGPQHFLVPFLAHALGTFVGAYLAARVAASHKMALALVIGGFFQLGGIAAVFMLPAPLWFEALDLALAYIPMAYLAGRLASGGRNEALAVN